MVTMARISRVMADEAPQDVAAALQYTRSGFSQITGREVEDMIEPLELLAHVPSLVRGYGQLEQASGELGGISKRHRALATLKAATLTNCEYCIDLGSQVSRRCGLSDQELLDLSSFRSSDLFSDVDRLVLEYAVGMSRTPVSVSDELFARLKEHFTDAQLVELTHYIALENAYGRFNMALGVGSAGFSDGMVCAVPAES
jgi:4-carboxymuconolactone decarboxylase